MKTEVKMTMPPGEVATVTLVEWIKNVGDYVTKGEIIAVCEAEKVTMDIEAPTSGILLSIEIPEGTEVNVGDILCWIGDESEKVAQEKDININKVENTKPDKGVVLEDTEKNINKIDLKIKKNAIDKSIPITGIRKDIAEKMSKSAFTIPHANFFNEVNITQLKYFRENFEKNKNVQLSYNNLFTKIVATALSEYPIINATLKGDKIIYHSQINIGIAVALENGLIVPVIKQADKKSLVTMSEEINELIDKARMNSLNIYNVSGGTFTITNLGMYDIDFFTPIINFPESAILGIGRMFNKIVFKNKIISEVPTIRLCLSCDHRIIDGVIAANFLRKLKLIIENINSSSIF